MLEANTPSAQIERQSDKDLRRRVMSGSKDTFRSNRAAVG